MERYKLESINPETDLVNLTRMKFEGKLPYLDIEIPYSDPEHELNNFGFVYKKNIQVCLHKDLAKIVIEASKIAYKKYGWKLKIMDGLRTVEAQLNMLKTKKENNWPDDLVSSPGTGAHPRGMAVDILPIDAGTNEYIEMGSVYDEFNEKSSRTYENLPKTVLENRGKLNKIMRKAAKLNKIELVELSTEWWDFRLKEKVWGKYRAISDDDLPSELKMVKE